MDRQWKGGGMDLATISRVLWERRRLRLRERWSRDRVAAYQQRRLNVLRRFSLAESLFYRQFHRGLEAAPLNELPPLTKAVLMDNFDRISTDPAVRLTDLESYLDGLRDNQRFHGEYWVSATSGSSGRRSVIPNNAAEWATIIASYARANEWAGIQAGPLHRVSMAVVSSTTSWHQSSRVAATVRSPFILSERLDAASPLSDIVARLNAMQPTVLVGYASMVRALADEQLAGRLQIAPRAVNSSSEVLTGEARAMAVRAWHVDPFNVYAATETGGVGAECRHHHGMHLFEDLVIPEVVDNDYRPVPLGHSGDRLLVTVLFSRTIPLIRYELTDRLRLSTASCPCGLPFQLAQSVEGRTDDVLEIPGVTGVAVRIHPILFHQVLDLVAAAGWQVRQEEGHLHVLIASPEASFNPETMKAALEASLIEAGAGRLTVRVSIVDSIPSGPAGKRPLVVAHRPTEPSEASPATSASGQPASRDAQP